MTTFRKGQKVSFPAGRPNRDGTRGRATGTILSVGDGKAKIRTDKSGCEMTHKLEVLQPLNARAKAAAIDESE